jgi:hypothetical protein
MRARGSDAALGNRLSIDLDTAQLAVYRNSAATIGIKHFPDFPLYVLALSVYAALRDLYDQDNGHYGAAIHLHLSHLATYCRQNIAWPAILNYGLAFFRKYQNHPPSDWLEVDSPLYNAHITVYTQQHPASARTPSSNASRTAPNETICNNFNRATGCTWARCLRRHICSTCHAANHAAHTCPTQHQARPGRQPAGLLPAPPSQ